MVTGDAAPLAVVQAACGDTFTVAAPEADGDFHHRRNHRDALGIANDLVRNAFVGRGHDFVKHFGGIVDPFLNLRSIFIVVRQLPLQLFKASRSTPVKTASYLFSTGDLPTPA